MNVASKSLQGESPASFLFRSFRVLDSGDFQAWLETCAPDLSYVVTTSYNIERKYAVALINDDFGRLKGRIESIKKFWHAEVPRTRTQHMVSNIEAFPADDGSMVVFSCFLISATRLDKQWLMTGRYRDVLRPHQGSWRLHERAATLDKDVLDSGKITFIV